MKKQYIAIDLGAESGRVILGTVDSDKLTLDEIHRFCTSTTNIGESLRWELPQIFSEIKAGVRKAVSLAEGDIACIAVDSWGVDFGLLDKQGQLLDLPYHYRDSRTDGVPELAYELAGKRFIYDQSGIQLMQINTLYQLLALKKNNPDLLARADKLLFTADLYSYLLCGKSYAEYSLASTSQLLNAVTGQWSKPLFEKLGLPLSIMPDIVKAGTIVGKLTPEIASELGCGQIPVAAVGSHDTASAVAAVPTSCDSGWAYLSCGTWSLLGIELEKPAITDQTFDLQFTNEGGVNGTIRLLKNIMGLWLVQESRRYWQQQGHELSYGQMTELVKQAPAFAGQIDPADQSFLSPGNMPEKINNYLTRTGQKPVTDMGTMLRIILESLSSNYALVLDQLEEISGTKISTLHIVGGGIQNELLCQFAANATGKKVIAGPVEATASGNILMQAIAIGQIKDIKEIRQIVRNSFELKEYVAKDSGC